MAPQKVPKQKNIASVKELFAQLGYDGTKNEVTGLTKNDLAEFTHSWRKLYRSPSGLTGQQLNSWKDKSHRKELLMMAEAFLEDRYGDIYWPCPTEGLSQQHLTYPRDKTK
jgi:hypothetical protein